MCGALDDVIFQDEHRGIEAAAAARVISAFERELIEQAVAGFAEVNNISVNHNRMVIPLRAVGFEDVRAGVGAADEEGVFIDYFPSLVGIEEQIADFPNSVFVFDRKWLDADDSLTEIIAAIAIRVVHIVRPGEVQIPGMNGPEAGIGIEEVKIIFAVADVVVMDALDDGVVAVDFFQVSVSAPPIDRLNSAALGAQKCIEVAFVGGGIATLVVEFASAAFHFVEIAVG